MQAQAALIDQILESARAIHSTLRTDPQLISHPDLIDNAIAIARRAMGAVPLHVELRHDARRCLLEVDAPRLQRALASLIVNAAKNSTPAEPVVVSLHASGVGIELEIGHGGATVDAGAPSGPGWCPSESSHLALDMALARQWVEMQDGRMLLRADGDGGPPSVVIRLPARRVNGLQETGGHVASARRMPQRRLDGVQVVLVEDDPDALDFLSLLLDQAGARLSSFSLAGPAFDFIAGCKLSPDVVVSDIAMPVEDGYSFIRRLRRWEATHARIPIPAIAVSAFARVEDEQRAIASGFDGYVPKPVDTARLIDLIASWAPRSQ
jgi:CheY-like chemotaxis protein